MQSRLPVMILLICAAANAACDSLIARGDSLYERFDNRGALQHYLDARRKCPEVYEPLMKTARAYNDVGEDAGGKDAGTYYRSAYQYADTLVKRYPDSLMSHFMMAAAAGNLALFAGPREKVELTKTIERSAKRAIELDPDYDPAYVILGSYYRHVAQSSDVLKFLARTIFGSAPEGTLEQSEEFLRKAVTLNDRNIFAHLELGKTLLAMDEQAGARKHLRQAADLPVTNHQHKQLKREARELLSEAGN